MDGRSYRNKTATTDGTGAFVLEGGESIVGVEIQGAEHPSYLIGGKAEVAVADGIATITGLVAKKRGAVYSGHVVSDDGTPAAKAWVAVVEAPDYEPVQTDGNGEFALRDVPLAQFTLIAAKDRDWTKQAVRSDEKGATLKLQTVEVADKASAMEQIFALKSGVSSYQLFAAWDVLGAEAIERFLRRNGEPSADVMADFGVEMARRDPAQLLKRAPELLGTSTGESRENLEAKINLVRAGSDDAGARVDANAWLDEQKQVKREIKPRSVMQLLQMAAVAQKLGRDDSAQWIDYAAAIAAQIKGDTQQNAYVWGGALTSLGYDAITRFAEGFSAPNELELWSYTAPPMARAGDVAGAQKALARMEVLFAAPEMVAATEEASKQRRMSPARNMDRVRRAVAGALAPTDPVAAWALAQQVSDIFLRSQAMISVGEGAQKAGNADIAAQALREVMKARIGNVEYFAQAAAFGARVSPQLGDELFAIAKDKAAPDDRSGFGSPSLGAWAFYHAPYDAAQSRVLIEREWDWRVPAATKNKDDFASNDASALYELVHAMSVIDTKRALEMQAQTDAIGSKSYGKNMSQFDILVAPLASAEQRESSGGNDWY